MEDTGMKAILEFDLPEDRTAFNAAAKANDMAMVLWEVIYNLRKRTERLYDGMDEAEYDKLRAIDGVYEITNGISALLEEHGIIIDDLTE